MTSPAEIKTIIKSSKKTLSCQLAFGHKKSLVFWIPIRYHDVLLKRNPQARFMMELKQFSETTPTFSDKTTLPLSLGALLPIAIQAASRACSYQNPLLCDAKQLVHGSFSQHHEIKQLFQNLAFLYLCFEVEQHPDYQPDCEAMSKLRSDLDALKRNPVSLFPQDGCVIPDQHALLDDIESRFDILAGYIQKRLHINHGDRAGVFFSDDVYRTKFFNVMSEIIQPYEIKKPQSHGRVIL